MATITLKNIPDELYERLKESAARETSQVSVHLDEFTPGQLIFCIYRHQTW